MLRKVYLEGEIGEKFGREFTMGADNIRDIFRCIDCNVPGLKQYLIECDVNGVGFTCEVAGKSIEDEEHLLLPIKEGDVTITAIPAGSKSGGAKLFGAALLLYFMWWNPLSWGAGGSMLAPAAKGGAFAAGSTAAGVVNVAVGLAINLALTGIQQLMAPDPGTDDQAGTENYLFNGSQQNIVEGDPVPVLYGELRVPGQPISFELLNQDFTTLSGWFNRDVEPPPYDENTGAGT